MQWMRQPHLVEVALPAAGRELRLLEPLHGAWRHQVEQDVERQRFAESENSRARRSSSSRLSRRAATSSAKRGGPRALRTGARPHRLAEGPAFERGQHQLPTGDRAAAAEPAKSLGRGDVQWPPTIASRGRRPPQREWLHVDAGGVASFQSRDVVGARLTRRKVAMTNTCRSLAMLRSRAADTSSSRWASSTIRRSWLSPTRSARAGRAADSRLTALLPSSRNRAKSPGECSRAAPGRRHARSNSRIDADAQAFLCEVGLADALHP